MSACWKQFDVREPPLRCIQETGEDNGQSVADIIVILNFYIKFLAYNSFVST